MKILNCTNFFGSTYLVKLTKCLVRITKIMKILNGTNFFGFMQILLYRFINVYKRKTMLKN